MKPGALLLKRLRATKVAGVDCSLGKAGVLRVRITLVTSGGHTLLDEQTVVHGAGPGPLLRALGIASDRTLTKAMFSELRRVRTEASAELERHPAYSEITESRSKRNLAKLTTKRADALAAGAVKAWMPLKELLELTEKEWHRHYAKVVMES